MFAFQAQFRSKSLDRSPRVRQIEDPRQRTVADPLSDHCVRMCRWAVRARGPWRSGFVRRRDDGAIPVSPGCSAVLGSWVYPPVRVDISDAEFHEAESSRQLHESPFPPCMARGGQRTAALAPLRPQRQPILVLRLNLQRRIQRPQQDLTQSGRPHRGFNEPVEIWMA